MYSTSLGECEQPAKSADVVMSDSRSKLPASDKTLWCDYHSMQVQLLLGAFLVYVHKCD